jgi:hypothetical protein
MSKENMKLWEKVQKSDPAAVKKVAFGARSFNTINANHQVKNATAEFGPKGKGWGIMNEEFIPFPLNMVLYKADFWWKEDDNVYMYGISSSISLASKGGKPDDEFAKKVATDALTKGLSHLGFNADIFLGMWDDNRYVEALKAEKVAEASAPLKEKAVEVLEKAAELAKAGDVDGIRKLYTDNKDLHAVVGFRDRISEAGEIAKNVQAKEAEATDVKEG